MNTTCPHFTSVSTHPWPDGRPRAICALTVIQYDETVCNPGCKILRAAEAARPPAPASPEVVAARLKACEGCDQLVCMNNDDTQVDCRVGCASCHGTQRAWVTLATGQCQRGKWPA